MSFSFASDLLGAVFPTSERVVDLQYLFIADAEWRYSVSTEVQASKSVAAPVFA